jgi:hypothetical protein
MSAVAVESVAPPVEPSAEAEAKSAAKRQVFTGDYPSDERGFTTFTVRFPTSTVGANFQPVTAFVEVARVNGLKGLGPNGEPEAIIAVERAQTKDKAGNSVPNPNAGHPTGVITLTLHTDETLAAAKSKGRPAGLPSAVKAVSGLIKAAAVSADNESRIMEIARRAEAGELTPAQALAEIGALVA